MRRPSVYQRSAPRGHRDVEQGASADYAPATRATVAALPALLREVERIVRQAP